MGAAAEGDQGGEGESAGGAEGGEGEAGPAPAAPRPHGAVDTHAAATSSERGKWRTSIE